MDSLYCKELKEKRFLGKTQFRIQQRYRMMAACDSMATTMDTVERIGKEFDRGQMPHVQYYPLFGIHQI